MKRYDSDCILGPFEFSEGDWVRYEDANARIEELEGALSRLVKIIDKAGLQNLSMGVQLGQTSWYVKASDALDEARAALEKKL